MTRKNFLLICFSFCLLFAIFFIFVDNRDEIYTGELKFKVKKKSYHLSKNIREIVLKEHFFINESKTSGKAATVFIRLNKVDEVKLKLHELKVLILKNFSTKIAVENERIYTLSIYKKLLIAFIATINFFIISLGVMYIYRMNKEKKCKLLK